MNAAVVNRAHHRQDVQALVRGRYRAIRALLGRLEQHCGPEDVHAARVAVRRLRTILSAVSPAIAAPACSRLRRELKCIAGELGAIRDADIRGAILLPMLRDADGRASAATRAITTALRSERRHTRQRIQEQLRSASSRQRLRALTRLIDDRSNFKSGMRADELLAGALRKRWKKMIRAIENDADTPGKLHALRIGIKKCRYLLDACGARVGRSRDRNASTLLHDLQDCLGDLHDLEQTRRWLRLQPLQATPSKQLKAGLRAEAKRERSRLERLRKQFRHLAPGQYRQSPEDCSTRR